MPQCHEFLIPVEGDMEESLDNTKRFAERFSIELSGDIRSGRFEGKGVRGEYTVEGESIHVKILEKPLIMPCKFIRKQMMRSMKG